MNKSVISNKENQNHRFYHQRVARKIINRMQKSTLNQSPERKRVETVAQENLEAISSFQTLFENQIQLFNEPIKKAKLTTEPEIIGWDEENRPSIQKKKLTTESSAQTTINQQQTRKSLSSQAQRIKFIPKMYEQRQRTPKTPLRTTKITSPLIEYPTMNRFKIYFTKVNSRGGLKQIIGCDRILSVVDGLNSISINNAAIKSLSQQQNINTFCNSKKNQVEIIRDMSFKI